MTVLVRCSILAAALFSLIAGAARAEWSTVDEVKADDLQSLALWQKALERDDRDWIIEHSDPPLDVVSCENDVIGDSALGERLDTKSWSTSYDRVITTHVKKAIAEATQDDLFPHEIVGMLLYRPGIAIWFNKVLDEKKDVEKYELESVWDWGRDTCRTVALDPRSKDYKTVPAALQGEWGIKGKCTRAKDRLTLTATTSQTGNEKPRPIFFEMHDGPVGAFQALEWEEEGELGHFNVDLLKMEWLELVAGWSNSEIHDVYRRCKVPAKKKR